MSISLVLVATLALPAQTQPLPENLREALQVSKVPLATYMPIDFVPRTFIGDRMAIYLNRHGGAYSCGDDDASRNISSIACSADTGVAEITPFALDDAQWASVKTCVTDLFAPFGLTITDQEPLDSPGYIEALIGGSPEQAGMGFGVGGVSPWTCGLIPGAVTYIFSDVYGDDARGICETAAQEIAHAFGLDHEFLCEDPMTYLGGCGEKSFRDEWAACGTFEPEQCSCGGDTQNSVQWMLEMFGHSDGTQLEPVVDSAPPTATFLTPNADTIVPANSELTVVVEANDDVGLTVVELEWDFSGERMFCPSNGGAYACTRNGNAYTWKIQVGQGLRTFRVHVRDVAGNDAYTDDRSLWFSVDGRGPPDDTRHPVIVVGAPLADTFINDELPIDVIATVLDDTGLARVQLDYTRGFGGVRTYDCPFEDERASCTVEGSSYHWVLRAREGERSYLVRAVDLVGNTTETELVHFTIDPSGAPRIDDSNDALDSAATIGCGDSVTLDGQDSDWFALDVEAGTKVDVSSDDDRVTVLVSDGKDVLADGAQTTACEAGDAPLFIAATPSSSTDGGHVLTVHCTAPAAKPKPPVDPKGCAGAGMPTLMVLAALLRRRRY